jgi:hypothetical protein
MNMNFTPNTTVDPDAGADPQSVDPVQFDADFARADLSKPNTESGATIVIFGIMTVMIVGLMALAIDVANWFYVGAEQQKAVDAAALAGVTRISQGLTGTEGARTLSLAVAERNGFKNGVNDTTITVEAIPGTGNQIRVVSERQVRPFFASVLGMRPVTIRKTARAQFQASLPMGSPNSSFGSDPTGTREKFWLTIHGPDMVKVNGDRYNTGNCTTAAYNCSSTRTNIAPDYRNSEFKPDGILYTIKLDAAAAARGNLNVEIFDPMMIASGDRVCTDDYPTTTELNNLTTTQTIGLPSDYRTRYVSGTQASPTPWCTGESKTNGALLNTRFTLYGRTAQENAPLSGGPIAACTRDFGGIELAETQDSNGDTANVLQFLNSRDFRFDNGNGVREPLGQTFVDNFRRWVSLCTYAGNPTLSEGNYTLQVQTTAGSGLNVYSIRATTGGSSAGITVAGRDRFIIYVNEPPRAGFPVAPELFVTRIPSSAAGSTLQLDFFDIGDTNGTVDLEVLAPLSSSGNGQTFTDCQYLRYAAADNPATGTAVTDTNCAITGLTNTVYNGTLTRVNISIPSSYTCQDASNAGCWVKLRMTFPNGTVPTDVTSWEAKLLRKLVRLIPDT